MAVIVQMILTFLNRRIPKSFRVYWRAYGGLPALRRSPYPYLAAILTVMLHGLWLPLTEDGQRDWAGLALAILPSMVSFSLGAMAIVFAMTSGEYVKLLHKNGADDSMFMQLVAVFFHFVLLQILTIFFALAVEAYDTLLLSCLGFWLFSYSLLAGLAAAGNLILVADIKNRAAPLDE